jgi:hypothetical protein
LRSAINDRGANVARPAARKALLLRVGMDRGAGGALGPIFDDGTFEYIPIPEREETSDDRTYATLIGSRGLPLADFLPPRLAQVHPHVDPDFQSETYGDALPRKRRQLSRLEPHDLLVFYCGLAPYPREDTPRLFVIAYFEVKNVYSLKASAIETDPDLRRRFSRTAHFLRCNTDRELVLVEGNRRNSRLLPRALPFGDARDDLLADLASFGYQGSVRRAIGHWVRDDAAMTSLDAWLTAGPISLIGNGARMFCVSSSVNRLFTEIDSGDLVIAHEEADPGDWVLACSDERDPKVTLLARINRRPTLTGRRRAPSSLFWLFRHGVLAPPEILPWISTQKRTIVDRAIIAAVVSWFSAHYRIGRFLDGAHGGIAPLSYSEHEKCLHELLPTTSS